MPSRHLLHRKLGRKTTHRVLMLRNIVSSLIEHESIETTLARAKEARRLADKMISFGKHALDPKRKVSAEKGAQKFLLNQKRTIPKLFNELAQRYANRPGGYTRVTRLGTRRNDGGQNAILQLVDGPKDLKWYMTVRIAARMQQDNKPLNHITALNMKKCVKFRKDGEKEFVKAMEMLKNTRITATDEKNNRVEKKAQVQAELQVLKEAGVKTYSPKQIELWHKHNMRTE